MSRSNRTDEEIEQAFERGLTVAEFEEFLGAFVVRPGGLATSDYRPHERNRFFPSVKEGRVVGGSFG